MLTLSTRKVIIDGQTIKARRPMTILEAARRCGIEIPTLCHVQGHAPTGVCRICVVEVEGAGSLSAACHTPVAEGMVIHTRSPKVMAARRTLVELMLTAHTGDCVNDPQAKHCRLHQLASDLEAGPPPFLIAEPRNYPPEESHPYLHRDLSKCILCRRCVTVCREIAGKNFLGVGYRGFKSKIINGCDDPLPPEACSSCGICAQYCPTGALRWSPESIPAPARSVERPSSNRRDLLPALKQASNEAGCLSREIMERIAARLGLSLTEVYEVASFYSFLPGKSSAEKQIRICGCAPCSLKGSDAFMDLIEKRLGIRPGEITADGKFSLAHAGCLGACDQAPAIRINQEVCTNLDPEDLSRVLEDQRLSPAGARGSEGRESKLEKRIVLERCGRIDPQDISSYLAAGGFTAFKKARDKMKPGQIIQQVKESGLTGRGGAGFSCGRKWEIARKSRSKTKYLICNADEGEVGSFKDRYILMKDPFGLIEGMSIAGLALGASRAFIYLRQEYHYLLDPLEEAIEQVRYSGFLAHMDIQVFEGAGAYICGEESALMNSIEGFRGESHYKPPYPPVRGLWGQPTIINNVETLMNIPHIINKGPAWFAAMGTQKSKGTKVFSVSGDVLHPGVYELLMGTPIEKLVVAIAGARDIKAVQVGGAAGNILPPEMMGMPLSHETCLGSGAVVVYDNTRNIIDMVYNNLLFLREESCGKCTPCRDGLEAMAAIYRKLLSGWGDSDDISALEALSRATPLTSLCGLGQAAPTPVMDSLNYFRNEYESLIDQSLLLRHQRG